MTTVRADVEEIQTTKTEKLLAVVLAAFLLLGLIWTYQKLDDVIRRAEPLPRVAFTSPGPATRRFEVAQSRLMEARARRSAALQKLVLTREAYRTALEAHRPAKALGAQYDAAQARYAAARTAVAAAAREVAIDRPAADRESRTATSQVDNAVQRQSRDIFFSRLGMVALAIVLAFLLLARMRRTATRWFPLAGSVLAASVILAFVLAADYVTDYFNPFDWGIAFIALLGVVATLVAYWFLQRYVTRRLPQRRVKRGQCPFCGFPGAGPHCEGCGREIVAPCAKCEAPRRVGTTHCAVCGRT
jgi:hypothetical protein